ncbi:MAG: ATP-binding cassette domain-containing protein, partial [Clostridia bacterium]|nr:ATP-binding cassette domain-containing protein [Clostridia bacterium]
MLFMAQRHDLLYNVYLVDYEQRNKLIMALIAASGISKAYSSRLLFDGVNFEIAPRDRVGLVGVNGCGKTTLFRILTGEE